jgi:GNAT superfamily N-acetyltransferase
MPLSWSVHENAPAHELETVDGGIDRFNRSVPALRDVRPLSVFARDEGGVVRGGAVGRTWGQCCELQQLWVEDMHRGQGVGSDLVKRFENEAARRGCTLVYLDTFTFQAPAFYEKLGYRVALQTRGYTDNIVKFTMHKTLIDA